MVGTTSDFGIMRGIGAVLARGSLAVGMGRMILLLLD